MPFRSRNLVGFRALLGLAALDSAASGIWVLWRPEQIFALLRVTLPEEVSLLRFLGALFLLHALCLVAAAVRPEAWGGLVWLPLLGRLLDGGVWLWLLGAGRVAQEPALLLLAHEVLWLPGLVVFLLVQRRFQTR